MTTEIRRSSFEEEGNSADSLGFRRESGGQHYPHPYPQPEDALGEPLSIRAVADLLGCSAWTVRHAYLPRGLPYLRSGPLGKLIFYRKQVIEWILQHQRKGGK